MAGPPIGRDDGGTTDPLSERRSAMSAVHLADRLAEERVADFKLIPHPRTECASEEAAALGSPPDEVGKTIVLVGDHGFVRVVIPASERLDLHKLRPLVGCGHDVRLATEEELAAVYPMFELGAVPPFGGPTDATILDRRLARRETVLVEAGTHSSSIQLATRDLVRVAAAQIADICDAAS
jgi:prolyl-tRNA editing enzyme YbaK/EbsC (Cys-tRNA(Pro) deacylase)